MDFVHRPAGVLKAKTVITKTVIKTVITKTVITKTVITTLLKHQTMDEVHEADDLKRNDHCLLSESCK